MVIDIISGNQHLELLRYMAYTQPCHATVGAGYCNMQLSPDLKLT